MRLNEKNIYIDERWTIFLDRDGVINKRLEGYVSRIEDFVFNPMALDAIRYFSEICPRVIVVTNQQGIGKELMTHEDLNKVHSHMLQSIEDYGGRIDGIYYCPHLAVYEPACRKPNPGMAIQAAEDFPEIKFHKSIMIGDSDSDIEFGNRLNMKTIFVNTEINEEADYNVYSLHEASEIILHSSMK